MKERPILFNGPMVRAILEGRKTQTRRVVKPMIAEIIAAGGIPGDPLCPYGVAGDRLWVKEAWAQRADRDHLNGTQIYESGVREAWYWADGPGKCSNTGCAGAAGRVRAGHFMPRWASRITLEVTGVRVERLQDISAEDAKAEGSPLTSGSYSHLEWFRELWREINGAGSWGENPHVWVVSFATVVPNTAIEKETKP